MTKTTENLIAALRAAFGENDVIQDGAFNWQLDALIDAIIDNSTPRMRPDGTVNDPADWIGEHEYSAQPHGNGGMAVYEVQPDGYLKSVPDYTLWEGVHWDGDNIVDNESGEVVGHA